MPHGSNHEVASRTKYGFWITQTNGKDAYKVEEILEAWNDVESSKQRDHDGKKSSSCIFLY
jgi:hypothetical protein